MQPHCPDHTYRKAEYIERERVPPPDCGKIPYDRLADDRKYHHRRHVQPHPFRLLIGPKTRIDEHQGGRIDGSRCHTDQRSRGDQKRQAMDQQPGCPCQSVKPGGDRQNDSGADPVDQESCERCTDRNR